MESRQHEMPRLRRGQGGPDSLGIAHFTDHDHIRILTEHVTECLVEGLGVGTEFPLLDDRAVALETKLDRVLDRDDDGRARLADLLDHGGERSRLARARHAGHQDQAASQVAEMHDGGTVSELGDRGNQIGNVAEGCLEGPATKMGVPTETPRSLDLQAEIEFQIALETGALGFRKDAQDDLPAFLPRDGA